MSCAELMLPRPNEFNSFWHSVVMFENTEASVAFEQAGWLQRPVKYLSTGPESDVFDPAVRRPSRPPGLRQAASGLRSKPANPA